MQLKEPRKWWWNIKSFFIACLSLFISFEIHARGTSYLCSEFFKPNKNIDISEFTPEQTKQAQVLILKYTEPFTDFVGRFSEPGKVHSGEYRFLIQNGEVRDLDGLVTTSQVQQKSDIFRALFPGGRKQFNSSPKVVRNIKAAHITLSEYQNSQKNSVELQFIELRKIIDEPFMRDYAWDVLNQLPMNENSLVNMHPNARELDAYLREKMKEVDFRELPVVSENATLRDIYYYYQKHFITAVYELSRFKTTDNTPEGNLINEILDKSINDLMRIINNPTNTYLTKTPVRPGEISPRLFTLINNLRIVLRPMLAEMQVALVVPNVLGVNTNMKELIEKGAFPIPEGLSREDLETPHFTRELDVVTTETIFEVKTRRRALFNPSTSESEKAEHEKKGLEVTKSIHTKQARQARKQTALAADFGLERAFVFYDGSVSGNRNQDYGTTDKYNWR